MALNALKIETSDLVGKLVSQLTNRPTDPRYAGGDGMTAGEVKARQDALGLLLTERFNALVDALVADPAVDNDALAKNIQVYLGDPAEDDPMSLETALATLVATLATKYALPEGGIPATDLSSSVTDDINGKYEKPATGIPKTDLASAVQTSLGLADTAYQKPSGGIPATDLASAVKAILDSAVSQSEFAPVKALAEGADQARAFENYSALVYNLVNTNAVSLSAFKVGQKIFVKTANVPDVWIYAINDTPVMYTYTTDAAFEAALVAGTLQVGYFTLAPVEGKTNLTGYATETYVGNAIAGNIDTDLDTAGKSADAKAVGDAIDALIDGLVEGIITVAEAEYANASTYSQQAAHAEIADEASSLSTSLGVTDETPTAMQPVGGSSDVTTTYQKLNKLVGCKVVKNQLYAKVFANYSTGSASSIGAYANNCDGTFTNGILNITTNSTSPASCNFGDYNPLTISGHKYIFMEMLKASESISVSVAERNVANNITVGTSWQLVCRFITASSTDAFKYYKYAAFTDETNTVVVSVGQPYIIDLTLRYGNNDVVNAIIGNDSSKYVEKLLAFDPNILVDTDYDTGSFSMCKSATLRTVDYNQWDEVAEVGGINSDTGANTSETDRFRSKNYIDVLPNRVYGFVFPSPYARVYQYDANKQFIGQLKNISSDVTTATTAPNARYIRFATKGLTTVTYNHDICIFLYWDGSRIGYEPSRIRNYPMPNTDMNGLLVVKNGKVVADGDELYPSGDGNAKNYLDALDLGTLDWYVSSYEGLFYSSVVQDMDASTEGEVRQKIRTTKYSVSTGTTINDTMDDKSVLISGGRIYLKDSAYSEYTATQVKSALSGVMAYLPLSTPTTLTASTFPATFYGDDFGTMWFLDEDGNVIDGLQGNEIFYKANVAGLAESLYSEADGDPAHFEAAGDVPTDIANFLKGLTGYDASKTQTLKNVTGTLAWVDDV